jgi:hypothetical protein
LGDVERMTEVRARVNLKIIRNSKLIFFNKLEIRKIAGIHSITA